MIKNWKKIKISELCDLIVDCVNKTAPTLEEDTNFKMIRTPNIRNGVVNLDRCRSVSYETYEKWTRRAKVNQWDVLLTREAPMGEVGLIDFQDTVFLGQRIMQYRANPKKIDPHFLLYSFLSSNLQKQFNRHSNTGSIVSHIKVKDCLEFEVFAPELDEQKKISKVLADLDQKIKINSKINSELENMAKNLYDYWFVQFDFPDENWNPYKSSGGKMVWSEELKREVPEGWEVKKMSDIINSDNSWDWWKDEEVWNYTEKVSCIRWADINWLNWTGTLNPPTRFILKNNSHKILESHSIIVEISWWSPTQSTWRLASVTDATIKRFKNPLICSNFCKPISLKNDKLLYNFVHHWNKIYDNDILFRFEGKTSGIKNLLFDVFTSSCYMVVPEEDVLQDFYDTMDTIDKRKQINLEESQKLVELRDWLLPMLMNGQVSVK